MKRLLNCKLGFLFLSLLLVLGESHILFAAEANTSTGYTDSVYSSNANDVYENYAKTVYQSPVTADYNPLLAAANNPLETGKLYVSNTNHLSSESIVAGNGVNIISIKTIEDENAIASLTAEVNEIYQRYISLGIQGADSFEADITATGSGNVTFKTGIGSTADVPVTAVISHYHNGAWTRQIREVDANGDVVGYFKSFSPIYITVIKGVTPTVLKGAGLVETEGTAVVVVGSSAKTSSAGNGTLVDSSSIVKSPNTSDRSTDEEIKNTSNKKVNK